jgi:hypothetical protein
LTVNFDGPFPFSANAQDDVVRFATTFHSGPIRGLRRFDHGKLNVIGEAGKMHGQPIECFPLLWVRGEIAYQPAFSCVRPELFQMGLVVLHGRPRFLFFGVSIREQVEVKLKPVRLRLLSN